MLRRKPEKLFHFRTRREETFSGYTETACDGRRAVTEMCFYHAERGFNVVDIASTRSLVVHTNQQKEATKIERKTLPKEERKYELMFPRSEDGTLFW